MRIIFAGTPDVAVPTLEALLHSGHDVVGVLTREDAPVGRKKLLTASPIAQFTHEKGIPTVKANRVTSEVEAAISQWNASLGVVVAYGCIFPPSTLALLPEGWINLHFSALPAWRGAAPAQHDVLAGSSQGHLSVFQLVPELDAGDVYARASVDYVGDETAGSALSLLAHRGAQLVVDVVHSIAVGEARPQPQQGAVTHAYKFSRTDGHLLASQSVTAVFNRYRAMTPEPGAWFVVEDQIIKVLRASMHIGTCDVEVSHLREVDGHILFGCSNGALEIHDVLPAGKNAMRAQDWWRGLRISGPLHVT